MDDIDQAVERIEQARLELQDALEAYRELLRARIEREHTSAAPNPKRAALYQRGIGEVEAAEQVVDTLLMDKLLLVVNRRFILHQAESPGGMVRLGMLTEEDD